MERDMPSVNISTTPPFILPAYRGETLYNTESKKNTKFLEAKNVQGSQQELIFLLEKKNFKLSDLQKMTEQEITVVMKQIGFSQEDIKEKKEKVSKQKAILDLYQSIESGYSQCHHTGNRVKASGGWYLQVCQHGVTVASKFLFLSESVRDVIDIHKSKHFNAPVSILDTPCTAAAHLILRDKEDVERGVLKTEADGQAHKWFAGTRGGFEEPQRNISPSVISIPHLQLENQKLTRQKLAKISELGCEEDPKTRDTRKYFLGDRFHTTNFPHKSELCKFHDINLCPELKFAKTSHQENLNNVRNRQRLRTTCTQKLPTHLFYNGIVMDRINNRRIVKQQSDDLKKHWSNRHPEYMFIV